MRSATTTTGTALWSLLTVISLLKEGCLAKTSLQVGSCDDLKLAALTTAQDGVDAEFTETTITCDEWTTLEIENNKLKLFNNMVTNNGRVNLENIRFVVKPTGTLRVDNTVYFLPTDDTSTQEVDGGALNVESGGFARFKGLVRFTDMRLLSETGGEDFSPDVWNGGAIYNEGKIRFDEHVTITGSDISGGGESGPGDGAGIYNAGRITAYDGLTVTDCRSYDDGVGNGAGFFNAEGGTLSVKGGNSAFEDNIAAIGAGMYNLGTVSFDSDAVASFAGNRAADGDGGHLFNGGGEALFSGGSLFYGGVAESGGAIAINDGTVTLEGASMFVSNDGTWSGAGAILVGMDGTLVTTNADLIFLGNEGDDDGCDDILYSSSMYTSTFTCGP